MGEGKPFGANPGGTKPALALAVLLAALAGCGSGKDRAKPHVPVRVATATVEDVPFTLEGPGVVVPLETVAVQAQVAGLVTRVAFAEGDDVARGQVLFEIDPATYRATVAKAAAELARDEELADQAARESTRTDALAQSREISVEQAEKSRSAAAALRATVAGDRAALEAARLDLDRAVIKAPLAGRTGKSAVHVGDFERGSGDPPMVVINQLAPIAVELHVSQAAIPELNAGLAGGLPVDARPPGGVLESGTLAFVDNAVDPATGTVLVKGRFANTDQALWPGAFVATRLVLRTEPGRVVVPDSAVTNGQHGSFVYVVGAGGAVAQQAVEVERSADGRSVIASGLAGGEQVVVDGQLRLSPGAIADVVEAPAAGDEPASEAQK